jgi:hypothetical protein
MSQYHIKCSQYRLRWLWQISMVAHGVRRQHRHGSHPISEHVQVPAETSHGIRIRRSLNTHCGSSLLIKYTHILNKRIRILCPTLAAAALPKLKGLDNVDTLSNKTNKNFHITSVTFFPAEVTQHFVCSGLQTLTHLLHMHP